jgi:hypothetical protein
MRVGSRTKSFWGLLRTHLLIGSLAIQNCGKGLSGPSRSAVEGLSNTNGLMRLETESPPRMRHAILDCEASVLSHSRPIHRLKKEMVKRHILKQLRHRSRLRKYKLQFAAGCLNERRASFRAHANPIDTMRRNSRPVRFDSNRKSSRVNCVEKLLVDLKQRLSTSANDKSVAIGITSPRVRDCIGQLFGVANFPPSGPTPTKSVSQNWHTALERSSSRPVQRLQPLNRQNTAALPEFAPSP